MVTSMLIPSELTCGVLTPDTEVIALFTPETQQLETSHPVEQVKKLKMNTSDESRINVCDDACCPAESKTLFIMNGDYSVAKTSIVISTLVGAKDSSSIIFTLNVIVCTAEVSKSIVKQF